MIKSASEGEVCSWVLRFALAVEHSFTETDLARMELQHQINDIRSSKKDLLQCSEAQQYGVITGSRLQAGIMERDDKGHATKAKKTNSDQPPAPPTPPNPIKTQNIMKTPSTIDPSAIQPSSTLSTHSY